MLMQRMSHDSNKSLLPNNSDSYNFNRQPLLNSMSSFNMKMQQQHKQQQQRQQQQHINQLLSTAEAGAGVVGDVDALLTPMHVQSTDATTATSQRVTARIVERPERNLWRLDEILQMLNIMQNINALEKLNDKTMKSEKVFVHIEGLMHELGYRKKSHIQIWTKWKFLKSTYTTSKRNGIVPKMIPYQVYEQLHKMLQKDNAGSIAAANGASDCGNSTTSMEGENSDAAVAVAATVAAVNSNAATAATAEAATAVLINQTKCEVTDSFGMAHPIFGFRLGPVKQEPIDAGYETNNNSDSNVYAHNNSKFNGNPTLASQSIAFRTEIKSEPLEQQPLNEEQPIKQPTQLQSDLEQLMKRPIEVTPVIANATSATKLPPLRIANFAKTHSANALNPAESLASTISLHMLNKNGSRLVSNPHNSFNQNLLHNGSNNNHNFELGTLQTEMGATLTPIKFPKEIMIQSRGSSQHATRQKAMLARKLPYTLKLEPNANVALTSPPLKQNNNAIKYAAAPFMPEIPCTSKQALHALQTNTTVSKKRKKHWESTEAELQPPRSKRTAQTVTMPIAKTLQKTNKTAALAKAEVTAESDDSDEQQNSFEQYEAKVTRKTQQKQERLIEKTFDSLRQMQTAFLNNFFEQQKQLIAQEHAFLLKQDQLLIAAFAEQRKKMELLVKSLLAKSAFNVSKKEKANEENANSNIKLMAKNNGQQTATVMKNSKLQQLLYDKEQADMLANLYNNNNNNNNKDAVKTQEESDETTTDDEDDDDSSSGEENEDDEDDDNDDEDDDEDNEQKAEKAEQNVVDKDIEEQIKLKVKTLNNNAMHKTVELMDPIQLVRSELSEG